MDSIIIVCAGSATRSGLPYNKIFYPVGKKTIIDMVIEKFAPYGNLILSANKDDTDKLQRLYPDCRVVTGGKTRTQSVKNGLAAAKGSTVVAIHDAARPFVSDKVIVDALESAHKFGSGIPAIKSTSALAQIKENTIVQTLDRENIYLLQTPQCFRYDEITHAYKTISGVYPDDSEVYRLAGFEPKITQGCYKNKKMTNPSDFLDYSPLNAIGSGFDVHQLVGGRKLVLGGVEVPYSLGLDGHSDADVLLHALTDALLSAAGAKDIGCFFPDSDQQYKNINSFILLDKAYQLLRQSDKKIIYVSCVIIAQRPKLSGYIPDIRQSIAKRLNLEIDKINISATTTEFMGIIGTGKAIAASAAVLCE